jgi:hypothetical protein
VAFLFVGIKEKKMKAKNGEIYHWKEESEQTRIKAFVYCSDVSGHGCFTNKSRDRICVLKEKKQKVHSPSRTLFSTLTD